MLWFDNSTESQSMQALLDQYETETGVKTELVVLPFSDYETGVQT